VVALILGAFGATHYGVIVVIAWAGFAFLGIATVTYVKDPVAALIGLWLFEVITPPISAIFGYESSSGQAVRQVDELLVILFLVLTLWRTLRTSVEIPLRFIATAAGVLLFGMLGAVEHGVPFSISSVGGLLGLKLWIMVAATLLVPWRSSDIPRIYAALVWTGLAVAAFGLADFLTHGALSRALHTSNYFLGASAYRSNAAHSIFPSPGEYSLFMSLLFGLTFARFASASRRSDLLLALIFAGSALLSLRLKGVLSLVTVIAVVGFVQGGLGSNRRALLALLVGAVVLGGAYTFEGNVIAKQVTTYASSETSARSRLYSVGAEIASDDFPLGVGFGRFASYLSRIHYSPVYYQYKLSRVFGLSPTYPHFIDDTTWPSVIGETGYGGLACYVIGLVLLLLAIARRLRSAPLELTWLPLAALCLTGVLLVDSLGEASLFSWVDTTTLALVLGPALLATPGLSRHSRTSPL
jgi:hypothetical protein